jgi:hypothetical protein
MKLILLASLVVLKLLFRAALIGPRYIVIAYQLWVAFVLIFDSARMHRVIGMDEIDQKFEQLLRAVIEKLERLVGK